MASPSDIQDVRENVDEPSADTYSDGYISDLIDSEGVAGASATIWRKKAGAYSKLVNTSEAGATRALSDLAKQARENASMYSSLVESVVDTEAHPVIRRIERP